MAASLLYFPSLSAATTHSRSYFPQRNPKFSSSILYLPVTRNPNGVSPLSAVPPARAVAELATLPADELLDISKLGISEQIVSALSRRGITELFPIQRAVLEAAMEGRDMIGRAITGSGKTLAFGIPILDKIIRHQSQHRKNRVPSALVLAPTRELARQVQQEFKVSAPNLSSTCLYGGISISNQVRTLEYGMDIVVGTPGRIIDLVERGALDLSEVKFVVLDEADQMLAIGFQEDVECILSYLPQRKQCMLFSATMPSWVNDISRKYLRDPLVVDLVGDSDQKLPDGISVYSVASANANKQNLLPTLISTYAQGGKSIVFTKTKKDAESLSRTMRSIIGSKALHGDMQQLQRDRTLAAFRDGRFNVLVATDVAARGLDIPNVDLVIHFEMPNSAEFFVHRSGRTGRAGNKGTAILMFTESQRRTVKSMERELGFKFEEIRGITGNVGIRTEEEESLYESDDDLISQRSGRPGYAYDRQYGNYGGSRGSSTSKYSEGSFRGKNYSSRASEARHGSLSYGQPRTQRPNYGDYDSDQNKFQRSSRSDASDRIFGDRMSPQSSRFGQRPRSDASERTFGDRTSPRSSQFGSRPRSDAPERTFGDRTSQWSSRSGSRPRSDASERTFSDRTSQWSSRSGSRPRSDSSDRTFGDRTNRQERTKPRSATRSSDYDFDELLNLFKDQD